MITTRKQYREGLKKLLLPLLAVRNAKLKRRIGTTLAWHLTSSNTLDFKTISSLVISPYGTVDDDCAYNETVMYTWENSPSCKKAVEAFETIGADVKIVRLDDPWEEGNPIRAVLGRKVGRTSVPFVFVGGEYIGGFDGGIDSEVAPGMVDLAFKGKLRDMLGEAGAMK